MLILKWHAPCFGIEWQRNKQLKIYILIQECRENQNKKKRKCNYHDSFFYTPKAFQLTTIRPGFFAVYLTEPLSPDPDKTVSNATLNRTFQR